MPGSHGVPGGEKGGPRCRKYWVFRRLPSFHFIALEIEFRANCQLMFVYGAGHMSIYMRSSRWMSVLACRLLPFTCFVSALSFIQFAIAQQANPSPYPSNPSIDSGEIRTPPSGDLSDQVHTRNAHVAPIAPKPSAQDDSCLLPPLNLAPTPRIAAAQLQISAKARKEYQAACTAQKGNKPADFEKHLRKAVEESPNYSAAWVTLGQMLAAQQHPDEARDACSQASSSDSTYVPAYLCLADIAARAHDWEQVNKLSSRALELDPGGNAVAYEYNAAANLNLHHLEEAEKSGLRAAEIDQDHREPRVYFVLAQIYEAKGDTAAEAAQLRTYLQFAKDPGDIAAVKQYLAALEKQGGK